MTDFFRTLANTLDWVDVLDMALAAVLLSAVLTLLRQGTSRAASRRLMVVGGVGLALYLLASLFSMVLVELFLRLLLVVLVLSAVVLFQSDIKRLLDRIGSWSLSRPVASPEPVPVIDVLTEAVAELAETHTGAIIAIRGREPWDSLITGGVKLGGVVSQPLLYSIFDDATDGHDGAVLMEGAQVTRFGVHLPLASRLPAESRYGGTRHAAALGLAENCDALVIVVSEERGAISIAQDGILREMDSASEMRVRLHAFWERHYARRDDQRAGLLTPAHLKTAGLASLLSVVLWLLLVYDPNTIQRTFDEVPIEYRNMPAQWVFDDTVRTSARVTLSGPEQAFRLLDPSSLAIMFDLSDPEQGITELTIRERNVRMPDELDLISVSPAEVRVAFRRLASVEVPVMVQREGRLPDSLALVEMRAQPSTIRLVTADPLEVGPRVLTEPVDLSEIDETTTLTRRLLLPGGARLPEGVSRDVQVTVQVRTRAP